MTQYLAPCRYCGQPSAFEGADECTDCWEIVKRLTPAHMARMLRQPAGRKFVADLSRGLLARALQKTPDSKDPK